MKRIAALILSAVAMLSLLTGCIHEDIGIKLNEDGTGSIAATVGIEKDAYLQMIGMGIDLFPDSEEEATEYEYKGKTYLALSESSEYRSYEELRRALLGMTYASDEMQELAAFDEDRVEETVILDEESEDEAEIPANENAEEAADPDEEADGETDEAEDDEVEISNHIFKEVVIEQQKGVFSKSIVFSAKMNAIPDSPDAETPLSSAFLVSISIEMPYEITNASENATVEGNKATFEIDDLTTENEFAVESTQNNTEVIAAICAVLVLVLLGVLLYMKFHGTDKE